MLLGPFATRVTRVSTRLRSLVMRHPPPCTKAVGVGSVAATVPLPSVHERSLIWTGMSLGNFVVLGLSTLQASPRLLLARLIARNKSLCGSTSSEHVAHRFQDEVRITPALA